MKLYELAATDLDTAHYDPKNDTLDQRKLTDTRKEKLTLRALNKLKKLRAMNRLENIKRQDVLAAMYSAPEASPDGGGGGMGF